MKSQAYRMALLFDFYGDVLTERQKEFYDLYYNEDLSLSEIAENSGITRQGVRDVIVRAESILYDLEDKTGLIRRFQQMQENINLIVESAAELKTINYRQYEDPRIQNWPLRMAGCIVAMAPLIVLYLLSQKFILKDLAVGSGFKG